MKSYIGITSLTMEKRWERHVRLSVISQYNYYFLNSIRKYGTLNEAWDHCVIETVESIEEAFEAEKRYILEHMTYHPHGYNMTKGGEGRHGPLSKFAKENHLRAVNSIKWKRNNSNAQKLFWKNNPERRKERSKISKNIMARHGMKEIISLKTKEAMQKDEIKEKTKEALLLYYQTHKEEISKFRKELWTSEKRKKQSEIIKNKLKLSNKRLYQIDKINGDIIAIFLSVREASRVTGVPRTTLASHLKGFLGHAGGYLWKFLEISDNYDECR